MSLSLLAPLAALPWLQGFFAPASVAEHGSLDVLAQLSEWRAPAEDCTASAYGGLELRADVASPPGAETVLASYTQGVFVMDRERHLLAQAPPFVCEGSGDEIVAIAAGDVSIGTPIVALAVTTGGRNESTTYLTMYRVANGGELQPVFIGEVEQHEGGMTRTGIVTVIPGGLVYRDPAGAVSIWTYDADLGRYIEQLTSRPFA